MTELPTQADIDNILETVARVEWRTITLQPGFTNTGSPYAPARYRLTSNNVVYLQGQITCNPALRATDAPKTIATLGPDARPGGDLVFAVPTGAIQNMARIVVTAAGDLVFGGLLASNNPAAAAINLPGIVYSIEGAESFGVQALR